MLIPEVLKLELSCVGLIQKVHEPPLIPEGNIDAVADHRRCDQKRGDSGGNQGEEDKQSGEEGLRHRRTWSHSQLAFPHSRRRGELEEDVLQGPGNFPLRIIGLQPVQITDVTDMVANPILLHMLHL